MAADPDRVDFFISYTKADEAAAIWVAQVLEQRGDYTFKMMFTDSVPGDNGVLWMNRSLEQSDRLLLVLSESYLASTWSAAEWAAMLASDATGERRRVVPIRIEACDPHPMLRALTHINLEGLDGVPRAEKLLSEIRAVLAGRRPLPTLELGEAGLAGSAVPRAAHALPPVWNIKSPRNRNFTGRDDLLTTLHATLSTGDAGVLALAVTGLGGVGKSQLAHEYAYRFKAEYQAVWWMRAEDPATILTDLHALAQTVKAPGHDAQEAEVAADAGRRWLESQSGWLCIFDNAADPELIQRWFPRGGAGHVLLTSRHSRWAGLAQSIPVGVLPEREAVALLVQLSGPDTDPADALALAQDVGCLPLALVQAAFTTTSAGYGLARYRELFRQRRLELMGRDAPLDHEHSVAATVSLAVEAAARKAPAAADLLAFLSVFAPDDIPEGVLTSDPDSLPHALAALADDPLALADALAALRVQALIERADDGLSIHRLVQDLTFDRLVPVRRSIQLDAAARSLCNLLPVNPSDPTEWLKLERLSPHAVSVQLRAGSVAADSEAVATLCDEVGRSYASRARHPDATRLLSRAFAIRERILGEDHRLTLLTAASWASSLEETDEHALAIGLYERALPGLRASLGPESPEVIGVMNNYAHALFSSGAYVQARSVYRDTLALAERTLEPRHPARVAVNNNFAQLLRAVGEYAEARMRYEELLGDASPSLGSIDTAAVMNNIAGLLIAEGEFARARAWYSQALALLESNVGAEHPLVGTTLNNLASAVEGEGNAAEAEVLYRRSLSIAQRTQGASHSATSKVLSNLARLLKSNGSLSEATVMYEEALAISERALGSGHPQVATQLNNLAMVLDLTSECERARELLERALLIRTTELGEDAPATAVVKGNLGTVLVHLGDRVQARALLEAAAATLVSRLGPDDPATRTVRANLAALMASPEAR
jgi:tetratricopeptide (TPR) repeat protein